MDEPNRHTLYPVSFYSYKGGVGRSVALLNTAYHLALGGRKVALLDMDLEAPGLHSAVRVLFPNAPTKGPGILDYIEEYASTGEGPDIEDVLSEGFGPNDKIQLIATGIAADEGANLHDYQEKWRRFNVKTFAEDFDGREFFLYFREELGKRNFDYLLIDSRTGLTDVANITTILLPYLVVLVTNLSRQSLQGTRHMRSLIETGEADSTAGGNELASLYERYWEDPEPQVMVVAAPVPLGLDVSKVTDAEKVLGHPLDHILYYVPRLAQDEAAQIIRARNDSVESAVEDRRRDPAFKMFSKLAEMIRRRNHNDPEMLVNSGFDAFNHQDWRGALNYFDAAEKFMRDEERPQSPSNFILSGRRILGEARALALGFQTAQAEKTLKKVKEVGPPPGTGLISAYMQLVRGHLASNELTKAEQPAKEAYELSKEQKGLEAPGWKLTTGLLYAQVLRFLDKYEDAAEEAGVLSELAVKHNRPLERVRLLQLASECNSALSRFDVSEKLAVEALEQAKVLGVKYLQAGSGLSLGLAKSYRGVYSEDGLRALETSVELFRDEGDGLGLGEALTEKAFYQHRRGDPLEVVVENLGQALVNYAKIAGTDLGKMYALTYAGLILTDHGSLDENTAKEAHSGAGSRFPRQSRDAYAYARDYAKSLGLDNKYLKLVEAGARLIAQGQSDFDLDEAEITKYRLDVEYPRFDGLRHLFLEDYRRARKRFEESVETAEEWGRIYEGARSWTLLSLIDCLDSPGDPENALSHLRKLQDEGRFGWSVWGLVRCLRRHDSELGQAAKACLERAHDAGFVIDPPQGEAGSP